LIVLTAIAQEVVFDGISFATSGKSTLVLGGMLTFVAAILAGMIARIAGRLYNKNIAIVISILISIEMTYLISAGITGDPIWFDVLAGMSLIVGIWLGYHINVIRAFKTVKLDA
jgi:hypothetical protein